MTLGVCFRSTRSLVLAPILALLAGCGSNGNRACVPGVSVACACSFGRTGAQSCNPSGSGYGLCECTATGTGGASGRGWQPAGGTGGSATAPGGVGGGHPLGGAADGGGASDGSAGSAGKGGAGGATSKGGSGGAPGNGGASGLAGGPGDSQGAAGASLVGSGGSGAGGSVATGGAAGTSGVGGRGGSTGGSPWTGSCNTGVRWQGDFDGDGLSDCAIEVAGSTTSLRGIEFHKGQGPAALPLAFSTSFATSGVVTLDVLPSGHSSFATIDLTGDRRADIVEYCTTLLSPTQPLSPGFLLLRGNADGTFSGQSSSAGYTPPQVNSVSSLGCSLTGDFNGDGATDLFCASARALTTTPPEGYWYTMSVPTGSDHVTLTATDSGLTAGTHGFFGAAAVGDFNGDGKLDGIALLDFIPLITTDERSSIVVAFGTGDGKFSSAITSPIAFPTYGQDSVSVADPNGDGKLDLLVSSYTVDAGTQAQTYYGDGAGNFSTTPP